VTETAQVVLRCPDAVDDELGPAIVAEARADVGSTGRSRRELRGDLLALGRGRRLLIAVPAHGMVDGVGERCGAQGEHGFGGGGVDDERFVERKQA
jgi:hypothetical protein